MHTAWGASDSKDAASMHRALLYGRSRGMGQERLVDDTMGNTFTEIEIIRPRLARPSQSRMAHPHPSGQVLILPTQTCFDGRDQPFDAMR